MKMFAALAPAIFLFAAAPPAFASDVSFSYRPGELSSARTVAALYDRLVRKAESACNLNERAGLGVLAARKECVASLTADFVAGVDNSLLTALHEERHADRFADNR